MLKMISNVESPELDKDKIWQELRHTSSSDWRVISINLEYWYVILSRGMQHWLIDYTKSAHRSTLMRNFERNPWLLTTSNFGWPSFYFGQPGHALYLGGVFA